MHRYGRADVIRILRIRPRQLQQWERAGLVTASHDYSFVDLLQLKKVRDLRAKKVSATVIRESLEAMQRQVAGMENPLLEAGAFSVGARVAFRHHGQAVDPLSGQLVMDYSGPQRSIVVPTRVRSIAPAETAPDYFARGISLEEDASTQLEAIAAYEKTLELDPRHAAAHINLGTLYYNRQNYALAEKHYRQAVEIDARYALAYFDLGNVLDETGRVPEAIKSYKTALMLAPTYADAHYNLALAYEKMKEPRKALAHWKSYVRLDSSGPWAAHARAQISRILETDGLKVVFRRKS